MKSFGKNKLNILPLISFFIVGLIALQISFSRLLGSNVNFTFFDFIAPTAGALVSTIPGVLVVLLTQLVNILFHQTPLTQAAVIRLFPTLFAVFYFSRKNKSNIIIPLLCMIAFNLHPIGRSAWQYSLFWLIPVFAHFKRDKLLLRSLGATFTAHAVGGALWVWTFGLTRQIWLALIPQVVVERLMMAIGISLSFAAFTKIITSLSSQKSLSFISKLAKKLAF